MTMPEFDVLTHQLVPKHEILSEKDTDQMLEDFKLTKDQLPKILITDPCVKRINGKSGDVIKITRKSPTAGISIFYRIVTDIV